MKTLVLYVFHIVNRRVIHFINNAIFYDENIDFIVISNGKNKFNVPPYVKKMVRPNIGFDFGGWSDALLKDNLYFNYDYFIFVNSSVLGPFINNENERITWPYRYIDGLKDNVKLFGSTINTCLSPLNMSHVQSYIFAMEKTTLEFLIVGKIFSICNYAKTFNEAINRKEVLMSRKIIANGWNIGSLLPCYYGVDFRFIDKKPHNYNVTFMGDVMFKKYIGVFWTRNGLCFIKGNRMHIK